MSALIRGVAGALAVALTNTLCLADVGGTNYDATLGYAGGVTVSNSEGRLAHAVRHP
jgi:hypothetical protein